MRISRIIWIFIGIIALLFGFMFYIMHSLNTSIPENDPELITFTEEKVKEYLLQEKGYSEKNIQTITSGKKPKSSDLTESGYRVQVVFSDEPKAIYFYQLKDNKVEQVGIAGQAIKHKEIK